HAGEARVLAVEARILLGPQRAHDRDGLVGEDAALLERRAHRLHLVLDRADADAQDQPAAAEDVERRRGLGQADGVVVRQHQHGGPQPHARRARGHVAQQRQRLVVRPAADPLEHVPHVEDVIVDPDGVEAEQLGALGEADQRLHILDALIVEEREPELHRPAGISCPHGSIAGRSGVNSRTRPATPARMPSIFVRSAAERSSSAPASLASTSAGVRAPTSAVLIAGWPSTQASAIWLTATPRGWATSRRTRSTTPTFVLKFSLRKIGWPNATPLPRQSRAGSNVVAAVNAPVSRPWPSEP